VSDLVASEFGPLDYHQMNHVTLRMDDGTTQVDHILVSRFGVFVIETKHYTGYLFANEEGQTWTQVLSIGRAWHEGTAAPYSMRLLLAARLDVGSTGRGACASCVRPVYTFSTTRTLMRLHRISCTVCAALVSACGSDRVGTVPSFDALFPEVRRVSLEEDADDPLTQITSFTPRADGGFVIVDGPAARVRVYDAAGRLERVWGRPGEGPGELRAPSAAAYGPSGELHVVERGSPRRTVFWPEDSVSVHRLPANYGYWLHAAAEGLLVGLGTQDERFGLLSYDGNVIARFGRRDPRIAEAPFWVFFVRERAAVAGDRVFVNSSFDPTIRVYSTSGDSLYAFGTAPRTWVEPTRPEIATISSPADRARIEAWVRTFTVVTGLAAVDGVLVVQYGRHDPGPNASDRVVRHTADVYAADGEKLVEGVPLDRRILAGGSRLYLLESEPPGPWTVSVRRYAASQR